MKKFLFWTGVGVAVIVLSHFIIGFLTKTLSAISKGKPREIGFHTGLVGTRAED